LLVRNGIRTRYPNIGFILSHAGGFVPYASHRMAVAITAARPTSSMTSPASTSTPRCRPAQRPCRPCWRSQARSHHVRLRLAVRPDRRRKAVRGRTEELPGYRRGYPRRH
jgi:hypothetical protein